MTSIEIEKQKKNVLDYLSKFGEIVKITYHDNGSAKYVFWKDGEERFYNLHGLLHRIDGPALISLNSKEFWINGKRLKDIKSTEEFIIKQLLE